MQEQDKSLFDAIRYGTEEEARELFENMRANLVRGVAGSIMARNFSHGIGQLLLIAIKKEQ